MTDNYGTGAYDTWKTASGDDPGRGNGRKRKPKQLTCEVCHWHGEFSAAVQHQRETGHAIKGSNGVRQDFSKLL